MTTEKPHSAAYFDKQRDFWWNADFVELMAKRLELGKVRSVLDVGCGVGHWGRVLGSVLAPDCRIVGIDREDEWVENARMIAPDHRFEYLQSAAETLPFPDNTFDMVTCQTVLIHVADIESVVKEMLRVLKPGGLLFVAEPNNFTWIYDSLSVDDSIEDILKELELQLLCEKGRKALRAGFNSAGDIIPGIFQALGLRDIKVYLSDKTSAVIPPYETEEQQSLVEQLKAWNEKDLLDWEKAEVKKWYLAGEGDPSQFEQRWKEHKKHLERVLKAVAQNKYSTSGGALHYLISGRK